MLPNQQVTLRPVKGEPSHLSKAARQVVPPFPQKLYEIVSDPKNEELIRWSENGDSFYVLNHERLAREVLGRWFKHERFTSFGVLKSGTDTESWNFEHPHFQRGQPDLLCLIQRKQPSNNNTDDADLDGGNASTSLSGSAARGLDIKSILNGIAAIKRHQQAISADLAALKKSNDLLWEEATLTRQRHDKQEDIINRILKFLAGVFGHTTEPLGKNDDGRSPGVGPRARQRLMISDGRSSKGKTVEIVDADDEDDGNVAHTVHPREGTDIPLAGELPLDILQRTMYEPHRLAGQIAPVETPPLSSTPSSAPSSAPSEALSPMPVSSATNSATSSHTARPTRPTAVLSRTSTGNNSNHGSATEAPPRTAPAATVSPGETTLSPSALSSIAANASASSHSENVWQAAVQQVLSNPAQMQCLIQALAAQPSFPMAPQADPGHVVHQDGMTQLSHYNPTYADYNRLRPELPVSAPVPQSSLPMLNTSMSGGDDASSLEPPFDNASRLQRTYRDAMEIEADMDLLQNNLQSLIHDLGMDPQALTAQSHDNRMGSSANGVVNGHGQPSGAYTTPVPNGIQPGVLHPDASLASTLDGHYEDPSSDLFLDSFLNSTNAELGYPDVIDHFDPSTRIDGTPVANASTDQLTAFPDEVFDTASMQTNNSDARSLPQKRKADDAGQSLTPATPHDSSADSRKTKRKR
ncbi:uncharacterized protein LAESUDRAFT_512017 [Laetiporus sulphureus 93-53]|uniref:HSF-type DNA-binding domain-containing protein n=1 Tax=Laetiporus sulphureus 93-53 TaxID=1314785 RepID=A0A165FYM5_9APHY|nr:uncharacterized protein LAESUDRAFT_512017 [Laetiporus sulphureus 93-53]KZT09588.1 hypothetical protein LAESUDRAFT_512017 [Laetiporus sulphureus 93-53]